MRHQQFHLQRRIEITSAAGVSLQPPPVPSVSRTTVQSLESLAVPPSTTPDSAAPLDQWRERQALDRIQAFQTLNAEKSPLANQSRKVTPQIPLRPAPDRLLKHSQKVLTSQRKARTKEGSMEHCSKIVNGQYRSGLGSPGMGGRKRGMPCQIETQKRQVGDF
ncbi:hypothetical protein BDZ97DRAFT_1761574 [Flammula alnicola]|nr:hypothetical protein BDZ97DRAFT_1761574 [Flammula alnicola]